MTKIINAIENLEDMRFIEPATTEQICEAQNKLGLTFADEYKQYILTYGVVSAKSIELTGISNVKRLDVVNVTEEERKFNSKMPDDAYVIANVGIDGIIIIQDCDGKIYSLMPNEEPEFICDSLTEYIERYD